MLLKTHKNPGSGGSEHNKKDRFWWDKFSQDFRSGDFL